MRLTAMAVLILVGCTKPGVDEVTEDSDSPIDTSDTGELVEPLVGVLFLNEVLIGPESQPDWLEIVNTSAGSADLDGVRIAATSLDNPLQSTEFNLSGTLAPGEFWLPNQTEPGPGECPESFSIPDGPITLRLVGSTGLVIHEVSIADANRPGISLGSYPDGEGPFIQQASTTPGTANVGAPAHDPCLDPPTGFDDHTRPCLGSVESFHWMAGSRASTTTVKFNIAPWNDPVNLPIRFMDTTFYQLHDEWYIFRMLNGEDVPNEDLYTPYNGSFDTIEAIYDWAEAQVVLPHDSNFLRWSGDRLYSPRFYDMAIYMQPHLLMAGTLVHVAARDDRAEVWGFDLEYSDTPSHADIVHIFNSLETGLPPAIFDDLVWIVRSPAQEALAVDMETNQLPLYDKLMRYSELSSPGEIEVYNGGVTAGRVRIVRAGESGLELATSSDILVLEEIPDYLPPCAALITAVPQTELAHINLLAKSRGIPNLTIGDVTNDPSWDQWGRIRARVAIRATEPDGIEVVAMTTAEYSDWLQLGTDNAYALPPVDQSTLPYTLDLESQSAADMDALRPTIGGKSAGMLPLIETLASSSDPATPPTPLALSTRAYHEHMASIRTAVLDALLEIPQFQVATYRRDRYLMLEGEADYDERYPSESAQAYKTTWLQVHATDALGEVVAAGGLRAMIRDKPMAPVTLARLDTAITTQFTALSNEQGLRFRSSSNVEDIEGFNGAGLYTSTTGFMRPHLLADATDRDKTMERAIKKTWASYWSWEAYEERLEAGIDHLSGDMGVLVHPRFDDPLELSNGVFTMTRFPQESQFASPYELVINAQLGDLSVTNPPPGFCVLPEVVRVRGDASGVTSIEHLQDSSESTGQIVSDATATQLFETARAVTDRWLGLANQDLSADQASRTLTLDFEYRDMDDGWPQLVSGASTSRLVIKQARTLDPSANTLPADVIALPIPRDILARSRWVTERTCPGDRFDLTVLEALTAAEATPDLGYSETPFTAQVELTALEDISELGLLAGETLAATHLDLSLAPTTSQAYQLDAASTAGFDSVSWDESATWAVTAGGVEVTGVAYDCTSATLHAVRETFLLDLLAQ